jgi:hypothetical protein
MRALRIKSVKTIQTLDWLGQEQLLRLFSTLSVILHLTQSTHDLDRLSLLSHLLNLRILNAHEDVMLLGRISMLIVSKIMLNTHLLIADSKLALGFLVRLRVLVKLLDCIIVEYLLCKLDVSLSVLVAWIHLSVVWKGGQCLIQSLVHLLG